MSAVWGWFTKCPDSKEHAICNFCQQKLTRKGSTTTVMWSHVKTQHKSIYLNYMASLSGSTKGSNSKGVTPSPAKPPCVQPGIKQSLAAAVAKPMSKSQQENLRRAAAYMCAVDVKPLSMVNGKGFRYFCGLLNPSFTVPDRHVVASYLKVIYDEGHAELKEEIRGRAVGLTTDLWTSHANEGYITVTAQYITDKWEQKTKVLATRVVKARHTGDQVSVQIKAIMDEYDIPKCCGICTDNAANMKVCMYIKLINYY